MAIKITIRNDEVLVYRVDGDGFRKSPEFSIKAVTFQDVRPGLSVSATIDNDDLPRLTAGIRSAM